jgi:hypothetical protein
MRSSFRRNVLHANSRYPNEEAACFLEGTATKHQGAQRHFPEENSVRSLLSSQENVIGSYREPAQSSSHLLHYDSAPIYMNAFEIVTSI